MDAAGARQVKGSFGQKIDGKCHAFPNFVWNDNEVACLKNEQVDLHGEAFVHDQIDGSQCDLFWMKHLFQSSIYGYS